MICKAWEDEESFLVPPRPPWILGCVTHFLIFKLSLDVLRVHSVTDRHLLTLEPPPLLLTCHLALEKPSPFTPQLFSWLQLESHACIADRILCGGKVHGFWVLCKLTIAVTKSKPGYWGGTKRDWRTVLVITYSRESTEGPWPNMKKIQTGGKTREDC